jgi:single-strand DNA-binding protein
MASLNKVILMGNLTREPAVRYTPGGAAVCEFGLAINRKFSSNGQDKEETCFVDIVVWGKQAESCGRYLEKGSSALVEGRLQYDQWQDKETNAKRSRLRIVAERVQFMSSSRGETRDEQEYQQPSQQQSYNSESNNPGYSNNNGGGYAPQQGQANNNQAGGFRPPPSMPPPNAFDVDGMEDDIPF